MLSHLGMGERLGSGGGSTLEAREAGIALAPHLDSEVPTSSLGDLEVTGHPAEALAVISSGGKRASMLAKCEQSKQLAETNE